jgi:hypothetical protein
MDQQARMSRMMLALTLLLTLTLTTSKSMPFVLPIKLKIWAREFSFTTIETLMMTPVRRGSNQKSLLQQ